MLNKKELEKYLQYQLSAEKFQEINVLPFEPLERIRTNLTHKKFKRLFVLGRAPSDITTGGKKISKWWCICDCAEHNIISVRVNNLTSGNSKSCGCWDKEVAQQKMSAIGRSCAEDLTGKRYGKLIALEPTEERRYGSVVWKCQCDCGSIHYVTTNVLQKGNSHSCGCLQESVGSLIIKQLLNNAHITYQTEKTFETCKFPDTGRSARFDFWIENRFLLEYDGEQHFKNKDNGFFRDTFNSRLTKDHYKNQWCYDNNIPLKRIPYTDIQSITLEDIMGDKYLI